MLVETCSYPSVYIAENKKLDASKGKETLHILNTVSALYGVALEALSALKKGELTSFDCLATDCSCHLRAIKIACIAMQTFEFAVLEQTLATNQQKLKQAAVDIQSWLAKGKIIAGETPPILTAIEALQEQQHTSTYQFKVSDLLSQMDLCVDLPQDLAYAVHAYVLTLVKDYKPLSKKERTHCANADCDQLIGDDQIIMKETTNLKAFAAKVKQIGGGSEINHKMIQKELYALVKEQLTQLSGDFILKETSQLSDQHAFTMLMLSKKEFPFVVELPDFYSLTSTLQVALQKQLAVILKIKKCVHGHRYQEPSTPFDVGLYLVPEGGGYSIKPIPIDGLDGPVIVMEAKRSGGITQTESSDAYVKRLMQDFDFLEICAMDGAQHKQYTSDADSLDQMPSEVIDPLKLPEYKQEALRVDQLKVKAHKVGCAFHQQFLLILSHIFADTLSNQLKDAALFEKTAQWIKMGTYQIDEGG